MKQFKLDFFVGEKKIDLQVFFLPPPPPPGKNVLFISVSAFVKYKIPS